NRACFFQYDFRRKCGELYHL
ncbi:hypothetical protein A5885_003338, partial [Enterococcus sp. 8E11_MSG4843]